MYQPPPQPAQPVTLGLGTGFKFGLGAVMAGLMVGVPIYLVYYMTKYFTAPTAGISTAPTGAFRPMMVTAQ